MNEDQPPTKGYEPEDRDAPSNDEQASGALSEPEWLRDMSGDQEAPEWLRRLFEEAKKEYLPFKQFLPTAAKPAGVYDRKLIDEIIAQQAANDQERAA